MTRLHIMPGRRFLGSGLLLMASALSCKAHPQAETRAALSSSSHRDTPALSAVRVPSVLWLPDAAAKPSGAASAKADQAPPAPQPAKPTIYRVAAMGDSLTDARNGGGKYLRYLEQRCPKSVFDNYGIGGEMVNQMRRRFEHDVLVKRVGAEQLPYSHVIVFGGVNDLYSDQTAGRSNDKIQRDLSAMYAMARRAGMRVVAIKVAPWGGFTRYFNERRSQNTLLLNQWIHTRIQAGEADHVIDAYKLLSCGEPTRLCADYEAPFKDGLHFGPKGQEILGEALYRQVFANCR